MVPSPPFQTNPGRTPIHGCHKHTIFRSSRSTVSCWRMDSITISQCETFRSQCKVRTTDSVPHESHQFEFKSGHKRLFSEPVASTDTGRNVCDFRELPASGVTAHITLPLVDACRMSLPTCTTIYVDLEPSQCVCQIAWYAWPSALAMKRIASISAAFRRRFSPPTSTEMRPKVTHAPPMHVRAPGIAVSPSSQPKRLPGNHGVLEPQRGGQARKAYGQAMQAIGDKAGV